jgi:hypothetical protein
MRVILEHSVMDLSLKQNTRPDAICVRTGEFRFTSFHPDEELPSKPFLVLTSRPKLHERSRS